jgi:glucosylceramidase
VRALLTTDGSSLLAPVTGSALKIGGGGGEGVTITVDGSKQYQPIDGFGPAMTQGSATLLAALPAGSLASVMDELFKPGAGSGITMLRLPMGSSDLSAGPYYSYDDMPEGQTDPTLASFSVAKDDEVIVPMLKQALARNPNIKILATPWSPPGWMKDSGTMVGGNFQSQNNAALANYFVKFIQAYQSRGIPIWGITPQNEPGYSNGNYPTAGFSPAQEADLIGNYLGPALVQAGLGSVRLIGFDHNWDQVDYPTTLLSDTNASKYLAGTAYHAYGGDVSTQSTIEQQFPDKGIWFTEFTGMVGSSVGEDLKTFGATHVIGNIRNWGRDVMFWGLATDAQGGPDYQGNGCAHCRGTITIDGGTITKNPEFALFGHLAAILEPGAVRIDSSVSGEIQSFAVANPDKSHGVFICNTSGTTQNVTVKDANGYQTSAAIPGGAVFSIIYPSP